MLKVAHGAWYAHPLPQGHRFPMIKYELIPEQLIREGTCSSDSFFEPGELDEQWILGVHERVYWENLKTLNLSPRMVRRIGFPLTSELVTRETTIAQGTIDCCHYARTDGVSMNVAGGTHHAFPDKGEGFCLLNDVGIAAYYLLFHKMAHRILVIDLDVHQGNGTAVMFQQEPRVFTLSIHGRDNYPQRKEASDMDIPLPTGTSDAEYLNIVAEALPAVFRKQQPDFVFYVAGVDILETDKLGLLAVSREGCRLRDKQVLELCRERGVPLVITMGGGYSVRLADVVEAHCNTFRLAQSIFF